MSSDLKDARWGLANAIAGVIGAEFQDFTYEGWQKILDEAQRRLDSDPSRVGMWASVFRQDD